MLKYTFINQIMPRFKKFRGLQFGDIVERFQEAALVESLTNEEEVFLAKSNGPCCPQQSMIFYKRF